jgi:hypothetical protein
VHDWLKEAGLTEEAREALERSRSGFAKVAVARGSRGSSTRIVFVSQLGDDRSPWDLPCNECRGWAYVLEADTRHHVRVLERPDELDAYDLAIVELTGNLYDVPLFLRERAPHVQIVGLLEGAVGAVADQPVELQAKFVDCVRSLDLLGVLVESSLAYYRLLVEEPARVQWLGVPYPKAWTDAQAKPAAAADGRVVELGAGLASGRNGLPGVFVLRRFREEFPDFRGRAYVSSAAEADALRGLDPTLDCRPHRFWQQYYREHLEVWAVLSLDPRRTWGRLPLDCASAQIPYVGSDATHAARVVGALTCDPHDVDAAYRHLRALASEPELYTRVTQAQYAALADFDEAASRRRFWRALAAAGVPHRRRPSLHAP